MFRDRSPLNRERTLSESNLKNTSDNLSQNNTMATAATLSYSDIQATFNFAKCMVPEYFGGSKDLNYFLTNSKEFLDKFTFTEVNLNSYFLRYVFSQVKGEARDILTLYNPKSFDELKNLLLNKYRDPCSEENLLTLLNTSFQNQNQTFEEFALEINKKLHKLKENAQIDYSDQTVFRDLKYKDYERQALYAFISGFKEPYCSFIRQKSPTSLDACVNICREYDNIQAQINYKNFLRQNMSKKNIFKPSIQNTNNVRPNYNNPFQNHQRPNNFQNNSFPRGPINFNFNHRPQRNFTNTHNFPNRSNVFRPQNQNHSNQFPKPTPMSVSSRNTLRSDFHNGHGGPRNSNHFARQVPSHPGIIVEELHNTEEIPSSEGNSFDDPNENFQINASYPDTS